jgi:hypothetical protein
MTAIAAGKVMNLLVITDASSAGGVEISAAKQ